MQTSGHVSAQRAHPVQSSGRAKTAAVYPCRLISLPISMQFFGQTGTQSSHALHRSKSISIRPVAIPSPFPSRRPFRPPLAAYSYFGLNSK